MKAFNRAAIAFLVLLSVLFYDAFALDVPDHPGGRVTDFTATLSPSEISFLNQKLAEYEEKTTNQIAVLIIPSLEGDNLEDYSIRLAGKWKIGQKDKDNGIILLIVKNDRKLHIEVGYGLEEKLTASRTGSIIRNEIASYFKKGQFFIGTNQGLDAIMKETSQTFQPIEAEIDRDSQSPRTDGKKENTAARKEGFPGWLLWGLGFVIVVFVVIPITVGPLIAGYWDWQVEKAKYTGGFGFWSVVINYLGLLIGLILIEISSMEHSPVMAIIGLVMTLTAILVAILDNRKRRKAKSGGSGFGHWAGGFSEGDSPSSNFSGGGFSGGGGGFGGGGASGSW
jgi:uncharacterized protein